MSPKTTPNAERPSADKLAASAGRAMASPAVSDKGPIPAIVEGLHLKSSRKRRQARADLVQLRQHAGSHTTLPWRGQSAANPSLEKGPPQGLNLLISEGLWVIPGS